jgi:signal transduction histidine kinase
VALAITSMVALAFVVPLSLVVSEIAHERALADARLQASAMVAALTVTDDPIALAQAAASTKAGEEGRLALYAPGGGPIGVAHASAHDIELVADSRQPAVQDVPGGMSYLQPVGLRGGKLAVIEVFVPAGELRHGVLPAWLALGLVAIALVAGSVAVADRLGARIVRSTRHLATVVRRFGENDLGVRMVPDGPAELAEAARSFNVMADRMVGLLRAERELAADLSHRLRTPVTALRLELEAPDHEVDIERLRQTVAILSDEVDGMIRTAREPLSTRTTEFCDLTEVLADRLAFWSVLAEDHGRPCTVVGSAQPTWVPVPRPDAEAAIDALLGNVFQHTPEGTAFRAGIVDGTLLVEDDGPGIPDPAAARQRGASFAGSTGLGLDIVERMATAAGGMVILGRSTRGGARVEVRLKTSSHRP